MDTTLNAFLGTLDRAGELRRVTERVSPILEIAEIADRHARQPAARASRHAASFDPDHAHLGGHALLFEDVDGCDFPLAINVFGSYRRMELALGCADHGGFEAIADRIARLTTPAPPRSPGELIQTGRSVLPLLRTPPRRVRRGVCQDVVLRQDRGEVDLRRIPLIRCWPLDGDPLAVGAGVTAEVAGTAGGGGRYITFAGMHTIHADDADVRRPASHNIGMYRAQLVDQTHLAMHWHMHHDGAAHWRSWKRLGKPMPIAICFGGESVLPYAATAPLPPGVSELLMAGFLAGRGIPLVRARTVPLWVPANCEMVIEGWVSTACGPIGYDPTGDEPLGPGAVFEGPFGDHTGYYSLPDRYPLVSVSAVTHRRDAVFPATIVGLPPQEDYYIGKATERIFRPLLKTILHDLDDYHLPRFGCFHNAAFLAIDKAYPLQARRVMHAVWGAGQMAWTKIVVVVDREVDVHDEEAVLAALATHCDFARDVELVRGPLDILDHAAPKLGAGHKIGFDATPRHEGECLGETPRPLRFVAPQVLLDRLMPARGTTGITAIGVPTWGRGRVVLVAVNKQQPHQGEAAIRVVWDSAGEDGADLVIAVDADVSLHHWEEAFFRLGANADPGRDQVRGGDRLGFDATVKTPAESRHGIAVRPYPPIIRMTNDVRRAVDARAAAFGLERD